MAQNRKFKYKASPYTSKNYHNNLHDIFDKFTYVDFISTKKTTIRMKL